MNSFINEIPAKLKEWSSIFQSQRQIQLAVLSAYLLLWLFSSGSLSTTIWVCVGVSLGWLLVRSGRQDL